MFLVRTSFPIAKFNGRITRNQTIVGLICCLLTSLSSLAIADETTTPQSAPVVESVAPKEPSSEKSQGRVARAIFTTAIADREPVDNLSSVSNDTQRVFFFSDLRDLTGQIVTHRWTYNGEVKAEVTFKVGDGARWRVYSSKNLLPEWTGQWTVVVSNESGSAIETSMFEYTAAPMTEAGDSKAVDESTDKNPAAPAP